MWNGLNGGIDGIWGRHWWTFGFSSSQICVTVCVLHHPSYGGHFSEVTMAPWHTSAHRDYLRKEIEPALCFFCHHIECVISCHVCSRTSVWHIPPERIYFRPHLPWIAIVTEIFSSVNRKIIFLGRSIRRLFVLWSQCTWCEGNKSSHLPIWWPYWQSDRFAAWEKPTVFR